MIVHPDRVGGVTLTDERVTIGRASSNDVVLSDDRAVSRVHAVIEHLAGHWLIRDLGSRNGTLRNNRTTHDLTRLDDGDEIRIGRTRMIVQLTTPPESATGIHGVPAPALTVRERAVLVEMLAPMTSGGPFTTPSPVRHIAAALEISTAAVRHHLLRLYGKFGIDETDDGTTNRQVELANAVVYQRVVTADEIRAARVLGRQSREGSM